MCAEAVPLSVLALDLPVPAAGWPAELVVLDDLGREALPRAVARDLLIEHRERQEAVARKRAALEQQAVEKDQAFRASLPTGIPAGMVPPHVSAAELLMMSDPFLPEQRTSVVEDALAHGGAVYHPLRHEDAS